MVAGNWKMNKILTEARALVGPIRESLGEDDDIDVLICPPTTLLFPMAKAVAGSRIMMGAQNAHQATSGAFTGEVSVAMLADTGCTHVIIGHSERRQLFAEQNPVLREKVRAVLDGGLQVIYCVGETLAEREAGRTQAVVESQLVEVLDSGLDASRLILAYEPVWAIGTGRTASPDQAQEGHRFLREKLGAVFNAETAQNIRILYGGSVKPDNAAGLMSQPDVDGALVGGACLVAGDFLAIIEAAASARVDA